MWIVELTRDDLDASKAFVRIGSLAMAISKAKNPDITIAKDLQDIERKLFAGINAAVQLGKLTPLDPQNMRELSKSDYGLGIVPFAELVEWGQATKLFDFRMAQYSIKGINSNTTMNLAAYEEYQQALKARRSMGRYSLEEAAQYVANNSNANETSIFTKLEKSAETGELTIYWPGSDETYKPIPSNPLSMKPTGLRGFEEAYWKDLNAWLGINERRLDCIFPNPDAPAAKVEPVPVVTPAQVTQNKLRRNNLDPAIEKAIKNAGNMELADVYLELKALAIEEEKPFTGALDKDALCYTDDNNKEAKLSKEALGKRLKTRR